MEEQGAIARSETGGELMGSRCSECPRRYEDETDELKVMRPAQCDWMSGPLKDRGGQRGYEGKSVGMKRMGRKSSRSCAYAHDVVSEMSRKIFESISLILRGVLRNNGGVLSGSDDRYPSTSSVGGGGVRRE